MCCPGFAGSVGHHQLCLWRQGQLTAAFSAVWLYATLPSIIKTLLGIIVIYAGVAPESFNIKNFAPTNIGAFLNPLETNKALYTLATSLDVVTIWSAGAAGDWDGDCGRRQAQLRLHCGLRMVGDLRADQRGRCGSHRLMQDSGHKSKQREPGWDSRCLLFTVENC